jgi:hypothetical protein
MMIIMIIIPGTTIMGITVGVGYLVAGLLRLEYQKSVILSLVEAVEAHEEEVVPVPVQDVPVLVLEVVAK